MQDNRRAYELDKIGEFLVACFVVDELGMLPKAHAEELDASPVRHGWRARVESCLKAEFGVDGGTIRSVYQALCKHMPGEDAICFILRGLGYPHIRGLNDVME